MSEFHSLAGEAAELPQLSALSTRQNYIVLSVLFLIFIIGLVGAIGVYTNLPSLYTWIPGAVASNLSALVGLMSLSLGAAALVVSCFLGKRGLLWVARLCFVSVLGLGVSELAAYITAPSGITMETFVASASPIAGHITIYSAIGFSLAGLVSLLSSGLPKPGLWLQWVVQGTGIFLMSLGVTALFEYLGNPPVFHYLSSVPMSISLFLYGVVLLLLPFENQLLVAPFFGPTVIQYYAWALLFFGVVIIGWQALWNHTYLSFSNLHTSPDYVKVALNEIMGMLLSSLVLALGLHILYSLRERDRMAHSLQESTQKLRESLDGIAFLGSTLSHDLKAPIMTQMKAIEMISSGRYGNEISASGNQEMLSAIWDNNQFELDLVLNLINLLRYKIQDATLQTKEFNLASFLEEIRKELSPLALRKEQELSIHASTPNDLTIVADPLGLKRVLHNLINNAILHMKEGRHVAVAVQFTGETFLFSVRDDGPGIPLDKQEGLFSQCNRMSSNGLGLYIAKQIVDRHGGKIWVDSEPQEGACFYFTIPKLPSPAKPPEGKPSEAVHGTLRLVK